jgi:hypothetical protein
MPLPFIPLLLGGAALIAGGVGVKKGFDAKSDFDYAKSINNDAEQIFNRAKVLLEDSRDKTQNRLEALGKLKYHLYMDRLKVFVENFEKIKNVDFNDPDLNIDPSLSITAGDLKGIKDVTLQLPDIIGAGLASVTAGAMAGLGAFGGVGLVGAATTGTAISSLGGAAATNATLAWFGGGSLAAGGFGMAGGTVVLGGVVAAPVLLVGGLILASKAEAAVSDAYSNKHKAEAAAEAMNNSRVVAEAIGTRALEIHNILEELEIIFASPSYYLQRLINNNKTDYKTYSSSEKTIIGLGCGCAKTIKNIIETPIFDEDGALTIASKLILNETKDKIIKLKSINING